MYQINPVYEIHRNVKLQQLNTRARQIERILAAFANGIAPNRGEKNSSAPNIVATTFRYWRLILATHFGASYA
ncbi:MAG: hypothetical protein WAK55_11135 [Xanthobacteraceae bacterium]